MRKIGTRDIFAAMRVISKAELRDELNPLIKKAAEGKTSVEDIGIEGVLTIIEALSKSGCEKAFYEFLGGIFEMSPDDVANLELEPLFSLLKQIKEENNLQAFFTSLSGMMNRK